MGFLEDLNNGKFNLIILIVVSMLLFHIYWSKNDIKEPMADNQDAAIEAAVKKIYRADVEAIRNLADISKKLQANGLTIPGNVTVNGSLIATQPTDLRRKDGRTTHFDYASDGRNYIRGNTTIDGQVSINGEFVVNNGGSRLILQNDGNLVLYRNGNAVWASGTR